jgi:hypothetical protein
MGGRTVTVEKRSGSGLRGSQTVPRLAVEQCKNCDAGETGAPYTTYTHTHARTIIVLLKEISYRNECVSIPKIEEKKGKQAKQEQGGQGRTNFVATQEVSITEETKKKKETQKQKEREKKRH